MYKPKYSDWTELDYKKSKLRYCVPMTAKALEDEEEQDSYLNNASYIIEEKFDGTRATLHFLDTGCRVFSRRISTKTNWFTENSDSLPQMRDLAIPELSGTVIDGEMFIPHRPFKDVSSTLNCTWDKAIERQKELGDIVLHAFDILYYKGINVQHFTLKVRKGFLKLVFNVLKHYGVTCIEEVPYYQCGDTIEIDPLLCYNMEPLTPRKYYESIVANGGEGVIIKDLKGKYEPKRSKAYLKIKKFYTRECILLGFTEPTKYYEGKFPDDRWDYWETTNGDIKLFPSDSAKLLMKKGYKPISKYYYNKWVGNMIFGVIISPEEINNLPENKQHEFKYMNIEEEQKAILVVGECSGFDDTLRAYLTSNTDKVVGSVIEVKCNEIFKDTGKLRHPRFLRFREDKLARDCTYLNHITEGL